MTQPLLTLDLAALKRMAEVSGYRFERRDTETEIVEVMIAPDGTIAVEARKANVAICDDCPTRCDFSQRSRSGNLDCFRRCTKDRGHGGDHALSGWALL